MDGDPVLGGKTRLVSVQILPDVDMNPDGVLVAYQLHDVPIRKDAYSILAFLDDNGTATEQNPAPDKGDLVSLNGLAAPKVTVDQAGPVGTDIVLTNYLPF